ncbi:helix-turn-helix domain-containing protein [Morganella morganii]|nr:XRE family transcriptional regulator [Morganella morganii]HEI8515480.1 XRE family transcriptional regulator [Morganella morganii]
MQKKEEGKKSKFVSIESTTKETFKDRLIKLIGKRSVRKASEDWGLPYSTLNNYLTRNTLPTLNVVMDISSIEKVSIDWLAYGGSVRPSASEDSIADAQDSEMNKIRNKWLMVLESIDIADAESLIRTIHRKGIEGILTTTSHLDTEDTIDSLNIRPTLKQAIKLAMAGDESLDQEILRRIEEKKNTDETGHLSQEEDHQKVG